MFGYGTFNVKYHIWSQIFYKKIGWFFLCGHFGMCTFCSSGRFGPCRKILPQGYFCAVHILVQGCLFQRQEHSGLGTLRHWNILAEGSFRSGTCQHCGRFAPFLEMKVPDELGDNVPVLECP